MTYKPEMEMFDDEYDKRYAEGDVMSKEDVKQWILAHDKRILEKAKEMTVPTKYEDESIPESFQLTRVHNEGWNSCRTESLSLWDKYIKEV